jgi:hypothetical protein
MKDLYPEDSNSKLSSTFYQENQQPVSRRDALKRVAQNTIKLVSVFGIIPVIS